MTTLDPLYLALDFPDGREALCFLEKNGLEKIPVKVGMELFYKEGPSIVGELRRRDHPVFLDVKIHDIPNTAKGAVESLTSLDIDVLTVHAQGGKEMMRAAKKAAGKTKILAVTQLTSLTDAELTEELGMSRSMSEIVPYLAVQAKESGVDGVVCSAKEVAEIKARTGGGFLTLTPGIRLDGEAAHDQNRIATPAEAKAEGADAMVVGRALTQAAEPGAVYEKIRKEWEV